MMGLVDTGNARARVRFQGWTEPDGCCAHVCINLRLLVKIRALSFHLCADWFARLATSNVCVSGPRLRVCWCWDIYMRCCRGRRSGTPVDFLLKEREKERDPRHFLAFYLLWNERRKSCNTICTVSTGSRYFWQHVLSFSSERRCSSFDKSNPNNSQMMLC